MPLYPMISRTYRHPQSSERYCIGLSGQSVTSDDPERPEIAELAAREEQLNDEQRLAEFLALCERLEADGWEETETSKSHRVLQHPADDPQVMWQAWIEECRVKLERSLLPSQEPIHGRIVDLADPETAQAWLDRWVCEREAEGFVEYQPRRQSTPREIDPEAILYDSDVKRAEIEVDFYRNKEVVRSQWFVNDMDLHTWFRLRVFQDGMADVWEFDRLNGYDNEEEATGSILEMGARDPEELIAEGSPPETEPPVERAENPLYPFRYYATSYGGGNLIPGETEDEEDY